MQPRKRSQKTTEIKKIIELDNNPVREYLKNHPTKKLSINYIKKAINIKRAKVLYYCINSAYIERVNPWEVGSYKSAVDVFKYKE